MLFIGLICATSAVCAADYYVSPAGTAAWSECTNIATPCSWQTAMANAVADDVVLFRGGTYDLGVFASQPSMLYTRMYPANSGTAGHPITFAAYPGETPALTGTVTATSQEAWFGCGNETANRDYISWDGFSATMIVNSGTRETAVFRAAGDHCTLRNSRFYGVDVGSRPYNTSFVRAETASNALIENNYFRDLISVSASAVNTTAIWVIGIHNLENQITVRNNTFENCEGGVYGKGNPQNVTVHNNFMYCGSNTCMDAVYFNRQLEGGVTPNERNVYRNVIVGYQMAVVSNPDSIATPGLHVYNNTIYSPNNTDDGIYLGGALTGAQVYNNILANLSPSLRYYDGVVSYSNYNNFYRAAGNVWNRNYATNYTSLAFWTAATGFDANSITSDPLFVNAGGANPEDYKLQASSPARTAGRGGAYATVMGA